MKLGIIGLKNCGKTTLFHAMTQNRSRAVYKNLANMKPNIARVSIPDERLNALTEIFNPKKTTPAFIEFVDIAGLATGRSRNTDQGRFLVHIREVDALIHVVKCFDFTGNDFELNETNPLSDISSVNLELMIADLDIIEKRILAIEKKRKSFNVTEKNEYEILLKVKSGLEKEIPSRNIGLSENEIKTIRSFGLMTLKPVIYCMNISESALKINEEDTPFFKIINEYAKKENSSLISVCAKIEEEISALEKADRDFFIRDLNIVEPGLSKLIRASYDLLGYISFLTAGSDEVKAWTIKKGEKAPKAAGKIHSDIERGFIRAEVISFSSFIEAGGSLAKAREKGLLRLEGKDYVISDGDIIDFRFNV
ncbi:MAG: redox-regulated ATPase YchF [Actinobacteria bacterium]|nr:redox-regulated ATPase YchF [Actinomycetota bacterium]